MNMKSCKSGAVRFLSLLLALAMVCSLVPPMHVHAAEAPYIKVMNSEGEETTTFVAGDPIFVEASSATADDWVGLYSRDDIASGSWFWYYVESAAGYAGGQNWESKSGETYNVYAGVCYDVNKAGELLPAGDYEITLGMNQNVSVDITIVNPTETGSSLEVENSTVTAGENLRIKTTTYKNNAWAAVYSGTHTATTDFSGLTNTTWYYVNGFNGVYVDIPMYSAGDYTVVLFADSGYTVDKVVNVTVKEAEETKVILSTDKTEYAYGEPINVTVDASAYNSTSLDWVGIFNKGAVPSATVNSYFWYYPSKMGATFNVLNGTTNSLGNCTEGEYSIILLANDGYTVITSVDITITAKKEVSRQVVEPTCEAGGYTIITYTDGTTERVDEKPALGHDWSDWAYDGVDKKTHTKTCANADHPATEDCTFDEGVVTKEATETENGIMTYTCSVCGGTYTEEISKKEIDRTETIKEATCEEEGTLRTYYTDGSYIDTVIPKLGHDYPETWTFDAENKKHVKVCGNDETHVQSEECSFKLSAVTTTTVTFTCSVCGGSYDKPIFYTDKTEYKWGEPILVSTYHSRDNSWVGLYKRGEPTDGTVKSIYWYYTGPNLGEPVNLLTTDGNNGRLGEFVAGEYTVVLYKDSGYTAYATVDIVITTEIDESKTVRVEPTCDKDGSVTYYNTDGTVAKTEVLPKLDHNWGEWVFNGETAKTHTRVCANYASHTETEDCKWNDGEVTIPAEDGKEGLMTYTCSVCGGTYTEVIPSKEVQEEVVTKEPTCEEPGSKHYLYTDGTTSDPIEIPALGHAWGEWEYDEETKSHTRTCSNADHPETAACTFEKTASSNGTKYTCSVCGGSYGEYILTTDREVYGLGEAIMVTVNTDLHTLGAKDWVGIWKEGETVGEAPVGVMSLFYYYPSQSGTTANVLAGIQQRVDLTPGNYFIAFCANDGYEEIARVEIVIVEKREVSREDVAPTCETEGYTLITYSNGSTERINVTAALGHDYDEETWKYDAVTRKHYHVCKNDAAHQTEHLDCSFDDGVVTKEPEGDVAGEKTYTCSVCGGTYTEAYTGKQIVSEEVTKEPTCTEEGIKTITYEDGTTSEVSIPALGHNYGDWEFDEETHTHSKTCANDTSKDHVITENCSGKLDKVQGTTAYFTCSVCGGSYSTSVLITDKTEYKYGDPIMVTAVSIGDGTDWVGIYKADDKYGEGSGTVKSIFWYNVSATNTPFTKQINVPENEQGNGRGAEFVSGEYTIYLFSNGGYDLISKVDITITADVVRTETVEPTCEKDGATITYYSDGTTKTETIPATGHSYGELWHFDAETHQHYHICQNDSTHTSAWTACEFDEGVSILEPEGDVPGVKEYTCKVCGGKYTETYFNKTVVSEEVVTPATCEAEGVYRYTYEDGSYMDVAIPKLGHSYGEWVYDDSIQSHVRTCANDEKHTETVACSFGEGVVSNGKVTYTCSVCGGEHVTSILITDKDEYTMQDDIMVTAYTDLADAWVGLYGINDEPGTHAGSVVSYYWFYVNKEGNISGTAENMLDHYNTDRGEGLVPGEYKLILFGDGGYDKIIAYKNITIVDDGTETTYEVKLNGTAYENGAQVKYKYGDSVELVVNVDGRVGQAWVGVYTNKVSTDTQFSAGTPSAYWEYLVNVNGKTINLGDKIDLEPGDYSVVVFADGGYTRPMIAVNFSIEKEASNVQVLKEPTCTDYGVSFVTYEDGTTTYLPIEPLGHSFETGEWAHDENERTHTRTCDRCSEIVTYACYFSKVEIIKEATENSDGLKRFTCEVCGGSYTEAYTLTAEKSTAVSRLYGETRFETSLGIAEELKKNLGVEKFDTIILASGSNFADALSGAYLANLKNAPILLCYNAEYDAKTVAYVQENLASGGTVYILGGEKAVSGSVDAALKAAGVSNITRLAGENRFETNLLILKEAGVSGGEVLVCTGTNFADVLSASAVNKPILLVYNDLYASQDAFLKTLSVSKFYIIGGKNAVSYDIEYELKNYSNTTMRLGGSTRYETSVLIAERFFDDHNSAVLTYGMNFPDGLCGGLLANSLNAPVILTQTGKFSAAAENYAAKHQIQSGIVLGGQGLISDGTVKSIFQMTSDNSITEVYFQ